MWDKLTRKVIFLYLYNQLFWSDIILDTQQKDLEINQSLTVELSPNTLEKTTDIKQIISLDKDFENVSIDILNQELAFLHQNQLVFENELKQHLSSWSQTYILIKAILFCFLLELRHVNENQEKSALVGKYLRLAQEYGNSQSVSVVHAVLAKILKIEQLEKPVE